jgi:hypothetical protein
MESNLTRNFFKIVLMAQVFVSLLNTLFVLTDQNAIVCLIGLYGMLERKRSVLLTFLCFTAFTACMDVVRILVYYQYISSILLGFQTSLGYYYIILTCFGLLLKLPSSVFGYISWRDTPHKTNFRPVDDEF